MDNKPDTTGENRNIKGQFVPGNAIGKLGGRPKGSLSLVGLLRKKLEEIDPDDQKSYATKLIEKVVEEAIDNGDQAQIKNILQYIEGMPKQSIDMGLEATGIETLFKKARE